jgi:cytochrome c oxidase assembly protein subunit 11
MQDPVTQQKNRRMLIRLVALVAVMVGISFAAVPLYSLFCRVTGYDGTTQKSASLPDKVLDRTMEVRFNADISPDLPWTFAPEIHSMKLKVGEQGIVAYHANNNASAPVAGVAVYNVTPEKAGKYFHKIQCFCFSEQTLAAGQRATMPVYFFIDPSIENDRNLDDVKTITLSYTFFKAETPALEKALDRYTNKAESQVN